MNPTEDGILPAILLLLSSRTDNDDMLQIEEGNDPVREFTLISNKYTIDSIAIEDGMLPSILLPERLKTVSDDK